MTDIEINITATFENLYYDPKEDRWMIKVDGQFVPVPCWEDIVYDMNLEKEDEKK